MFAELQGLSAWTIKAYQKGIIDHQVNHFLPRILFFTLTNVNFDSSRIIAYTREAIAKRAALKIQCLAREPTIIINHLMAELQLFSDDSSELQYQAAEYALNKDKAVIGENILGLCLLCLYSSKGAAAYMEHARVLGQYNNDIYYQYHKIMAWLGSLSSDMDALLQCAMEIVQINFKVMGTLDVSATDIYGHPIPTQVNVKSIAGKCILVSGHDLKELHNLLQQTAVTGINILTHGEMLPAHCYPEIHKFKHLAGNYRGVWQDQQSEFAQFPGPIIMTSNYIIDPFVGNYSNRIWSRSIVGWPEIN